MQIDKECFECKEDLTQKEIDYRNSLIFTNYNQLILCDDCYYKDKVQNNAKDN